MKRSFEGKGGDGPSRKGRKGESAAPRQDVGPCVLKFLTPEVLASAVIGKGGAVIAEMRQSTQAKIALSDHAEFYPGTDCRVLTASANTEDSLNELAFQFIGKIKDCTQAPNASADLGTPDELRLQTVMPRTAVGGIIGKGGAAIKKLREMSGAKISVGDTMGSGAGSEQVVTISGTEQALEYVMKEANTQVQNLGQEEWFLDWAGTSGAVRGGGGHGGGKDGGGYGGPPMGKGGGGYGGPPMGKGGGGYGRSTSLDMMIGVAHELPPFVMDDGRGFAMSCVVPNRLVGGLIGRSGANTKEIQNRTGTTIAIREIPGDPENRSLNISGPLAAACSAYMLMMKRYLEVESDAAEDPPPFRGDSGKDGKKGGKGGKKGGKDGKR